MKTHTVGFPESGAMIGLARIREYFRVLTELAHILPARKYQMPEEDEQTSLGSVFEGTVSRYPDNIMLIFEGRQWTYAQFNAEVNRLARVLAGKGISRGDTVAIFMENRAEYILAMLALVKLGASASLINNSLTGGGSLALSFSYECQGLYRRRREIGSFRLDTRRTQLDRYRAAAVVF